MSTSIIQIKKSALAKNVKFVKELVGNKVKISAVSGFSFFCNVLRGVVLNVFSTIKPRKISEVRQLELQERP